MPQQKKAAKPGGQRASSQRASSQRAQPQSELDFLQAADEQEAGGGKWKAGDAAKAARFFARAVDVYSAGLDRFPRSFDLAYNKAHLQYELCQDPRLAPRLGPRLDLLRAALEAHRAALRLNEENADVLFNTAQVLTSIAEELQDSGDAGDRASAVRLLQEAVELFSSCLSRQEMSFSEQQAELTDAGEQLAGPVSVADGDSHRNQEAAAASYTSSPAATQWATVEEPITPVALLETALAQLSCLSSLISYSVPLESRSLASLAEIAVPLVRTKIPAYLSQIPTFPEDPSPSPTVAVLSITSHDFSSFTPSEARKKPKNPRADAEAESGLAIASFHAAIAEAEYRSNLSSMGSYASALKEAFDPLIRPDGQSFASNDTLSGVRSVSHHIAAAAAYADALDDLATAAMQRGCLNADSALSSAIDVSSQVLDAVLPADPQNPSRPLGGGSGELIPFLKQARILSLRADIELRKWSLVTPAQRTAAGVSRALQLYEAAAQCAVRARDGKEVDDDGADPDDLANENSAKAVIIEALTRTGPVSTPANALPVRDAVEEMAQRCLLSRETAEALMNDARLSVK